MLTQSELKSLLNYGTNTGIFTRIKTRSPFVRCGDIAGNIATRKCGKKYVKIQIHNKSYLAHRLAWLYVYGYFPKKEIDHINGQGIDNRIINLRDVSSRENHKNKKKPSNNTSGIVGVRFKLSVNKFEARIVLDGVYTYIGCFDNIFDAACARKSAEIKHGFHENHGSDRPL